MKQTKLFCHKVNGEYMHFHPSIIQVKMCFPYGYKVEIERGKGNIYGLVVEEV